MELYKLTKQGENPVITVKRAYNKYLFDKTWYEDMLRLKDEHCKQMGIILTYAAKLKLDISSAMALKTQNPLNSKDP